MSSNYVDPTQLFSEPIHIEITTSLADIIDDMLAEGSYILTPRTHTYITDDAGNQLRISAIMINDHNVMLNLYGIGYVSIPYEWGGDYQVSEWIWI